MNILFFLIPKKNVEYALENFSIRQLLEKMDYHHYTAIPVLSEDGHYLLTVSEGDLLRHVKEFKLDRDAIMTSSIKDIPIQRKIEPITIEKDIDDLFHLAEKQNFIPVVDDRGLFIGIITRQAIIQYMENQIKTLK
jgi:CBS domain-containing protein